MNLLELFEQYGVTFVSVTQSFNTKDAMGRMTVSILMVFAQFEREVIGERIRDKVAASRKKGKWMGGWTPLGYEVRDRKLIIHEADAPRVRGIFRRFVQLKSATLLARELVAAGERNRYGHLLDKGVLYKLLNNRVYIGDAVHKGTAYPGEHEPIIDRALWDQVHALHFGRADPLHPSSAGRSEASCHAGKCSALDPTSSSRGRHSD
jgi:site-specific DNA recombinase